MTQNKRAIHLLMLGLLFSIINWIIIKKLIVEISIFQYFFIEIILVLSMKIYKFTKQKVDL
jgi:hypothetical protein